MANNVIANILMAIVAKADISGLDKTTSSIKKMGTQASKTGSLLQKMSSKLLGGFNIHNILDWGSKYLQFEKDLGAMQSRFYAITGDQSKAREEFEYVRKLATDTSNDIKATADNYSIFYAATQKSMGTDSARQVFKDWTEVGRVLHLNTYQFERVTYALREMASKGAIYSQDLRMQIGTHVPNAMGLAEKAVNDLGITGTDWFDTFQKKAKGNQALINEFIKGFSRYANMEFASPKALKEALRQPDALAYAIKNIGTNFMIEFSRKGGNELVINTLEAIKNSLLKIDYEKWSTNLGIMAKGISQIVPLLVQLRSDLLWTFGFFYAQKILGGIAKFITSFRRGFLVGLMKNLGLSKFMGRAILKEGFIKGFGTIISKLGLKVFLPKLFGLLGGPILGAIMWLPEIIHVLKWIWNKISGKDAKNKRAGEFTDFIEGFGKSGSDILNMMKLIQEARNKNSNFTTNDARLMAEKYVGKEGAKLVNITDKGQVLLQFNGSFISIEEIQEMIENAAKKQIEEKESFWDRFKSKPQNDSIEEIL